VALHRRDPAPSPARRGPCSCCATSRAASAKETARPARDDRGVGELRAAARAAGLARAACPRGPARRCNTPPSPPPPAGACSPATVECSERADAEGLAALMHEDVRFSMPPTPGVWTGRSTVVQGWIDGGFGSEAFGSTRCVVTPRQRSARGRGLRAQAGRPSRTNRWRSCLAGAGRGRHRDLVHLRRRGVRALRPAATLGAAA